MWILHIVFSDVGQLVFSNFGVGFGKECIFTNYIAIVDLAHSKRADLRHYEPNVTLLGRYLILILARRPALLDTTDTPISWVKKLSD